MNPDKIGKFINKLRVEKKLSQYQLADLIPITRQAVSKWERGQTIPDSSTLLKLSEIFDVTINELLMGERIKEQSIQQLEKTTLSILDERNKTKKEIKKIVTLSITIIFILLISFLFYYFINSYNTVKVYTVSGKSQQFDLYDGIFIVTKQKTYLKIGKIKSNNGNEIKNIKIYYWKNKKEVLISKDFDIDKTIINQYGYDKKYNQKEINTLLKNTYIEITFDDNQKEVIKIKYIRDFINNNLFFLKEHKMTDNNDNKTQNKRIKVDKYIEFIIKNGIKKSEIYSYELEDEKLQFTYDEDMKTIRMYKNNQIIWTYMILSNQCNKEEQNQETDDKKCRKTVVEDLNKYLKENGGT